MGNEAIGQRVAKVPCTSRGKVFLNPRGLQRVLASAGIRPREGIRGNMASSAHSSICVCLLRLLFFFLNQSHSGAKSRKRLLTFGSSGDLIYTEELDIPNISEEMGGERKRIKEKRRERKGEREVGRDGGGKREKEKKREAIVC